MESVTMVQIFYEDFVSLRAQTLEYQSILLPATGG